MNLEEGTQAAILMIEADLARVGLSGALDAASPDGDIGKFSLFGQSVRVITHRDGYYLNINLAWFNGADVPAQISGGPIEIYCFVLKGPVPRYWLCDWRTMRRFVFDFSASSLPHYKRTVRWRSDVQAIQHAADAALFRWGDENGMEQLQKPSRIVDLGNATSVQPVPTVMVGTPVLVAISEMSNDDPTRALLKSASVRAAVGSTRLAVLADV